MTITDIDQFRRALSTLERAGAAIRDKVTNPTPEESEPYRNFYRQFEAEAQNNKGRFSLMAGATTCGRCGRLPAETRFVEIFVPPALHLHLIRVNGQFRILAADLPAD